jgi:hypothetical protein
MLSLTAQAQTKPTATVERLHLAIANGDRATAAAPLSAEVQIFESGYVERSREEYLSHHFESDAKFARAVARTVTRQSEQVAG